MPRVRPRIKYRADSLASSGYSLFLQDQRPVRISRTHEVDEGADFGGGQPPGRVQAQSTGATPDTIHHGGQGVQYTCKAYREHLQRTGLVASMSRKGMPYDNAVMESFFSSLKHEPTHHERLDSREEARSRIFDCIELFYNRKRLHSTLGYRSSAQAEMMAMVPN